MIRNEKEKLKFELQKQSQNENQKDETKDQTLHFEELLKSQMQLHFFHNLQVNFQILLKFQLCSISKAI